MTKRISEIEKLADDNIRKWMAAGQVRERSKKGKTGENIGPYIVISRETGAGGSEIARLVGEKLGWNVLDREIIDYVAEKCNKPRDLVEFVDENRVNWIQDIITNWIQGQNLNQATYLQRLTQLFSQAARHGNVVIVGRGAQFILPHDRGLSVRILAPVDFRVEQVLLQRGLSADEARKFVQESDQSQKAFVKRYFHHNVTDPHMHDLVINVEKLVREDAANLITAAALSWMKESGIGV